ncbi:MAG: hypothetical protein RLZZ387_544 [Chloroflexota bacterium]|jgi:peptide/nickel transport system ATP-binding protein
MSDHETFISASGLHKIFKVADLEVVALQGLDLEVAREEMLALVGPSGSGKSTLLSAIGGLDKPSAGRLTVGGRDLVKLDQGELTAYRRTQIGFIWQQTTRNVLPYLTARENVELLMALGGAEGLGRARERRAWATELLDAVGMAEHADKRPTQLSGGQQQRVAIACALANRPAILLGDEPTGEVDWPTAQLILALLRDLRARYGLTVVIVTHDPRVAEQADRVVAIRDGRTSTEMVRAREKQPADSQNGFQSAPSAAEPRSSNELVVVDRAGWLQIPIEQRELAGIGLRARVELVDGGVLIRSIDDDRAEGAEAPAEHGSVGEAAEASYESLYSAAPLPSGEGGAPRRWRLPKIGRDRKAGGAR